MKKGFTNKRFDNTSDNTSNKDASSTKYADQKYVIQIFQTWIEKFKYRIRKGSVR